MLQFKRNTAKQKYAEQGGNIVFENQMIISGKELKEKGLTYYKINQIVEKGFLENSIRDTMRI